MLETLTCDTRRRGRFPKGDSAQMAAVLIHKSHLKPFAGDNCWDEVLNAAIKLNRKRVRDKIEAVMDAIPSLPTKLAKMMIDYTGV